MWLVTGAIFVIGLVLLLDSTSQACYVFPIEVPDPCRGVTCPPGAQCLPAADGKASECHCPSECPDYGDHAGARPLCGSDARDYAGECEMRRAACESAVNITVKYYGKCDPCAGVACPDPEVCQLDESRAPACRCAEPCPLEFSPVCASDGKTYSNLCQMNRESCRARKQLRVIFKGQCTSGENACAQLACRHGECLVDAAGAAQCACGACEPVLRPVCGSDGRTHDSECELRRAACRASRDLRVLHAGACGSRGACVGRVCLHGGECVASGGGGGAGECRCPRCSAEFAPVCGSDGISYGNRCKLQLEACRHKREVSVLYDGPCNGCENKKCEFYAVCESDGVSEASCVCPKHCEEGTETEEVCGSENRTFSSLCSLRDFACKERKHIVVKHMGSCESCLGVECPADARCARGACTCATSCAGASLEPVCSTTRRTFPHECALRRAACEARARGDSTPIRVAFYGECRERTQAGGSNRSAKITELSNDIHSSSIEQGAAAGGEGAEGAESAGEGGGEAARGEGGAGKACSNIHCDYSATCAIGADGLPRCSCLFDCASVSPAPVCASDMRLYPTLCHMKLEACQRQEDLRLRPLELCRGLEVKPCGGQPPLTDPATARPLDCGSGPSRRDCPAGSYCHQTSKSARCCKKDTQVEEKKGCEDSWHGCCPDGQTASRGPGGAGCPQTCGCNRLGSFSERCAADSGQCECRPGVGGLKCDRCEPGYWGLSRIGTGHSGCIPCGCSAFGSVREDCEQMTGRCVCRPGLQGQKCAVCSDHQHALGPAGCYDDQYLARLSANTKRSANKSVSCSGLIPEPQLVYRKQNEHKLLTTYIKPKSNITIKTSIEDDFPYAELENKRPTIQIPLLDGKVQLKTRLRLPSHRFDLWADVWTAPGCREGSIISGSGGNGDHVWLGLRGQSAELRWDAGSGMISLRVGSIGTYRGGYARIEARRYRRDGLLRVDRGVVRGSAPGNMTALDLDGFLYIGVPPSNVTKTAGELKNVGGFVGCIHRLRIGHTILIPPLDPSLLLVDPGVKECTPTNMASLSCSKIRKNSP